LEIEVVGGNLISNHFDKQICKKREKSFEDEKGVLNDFE
jgi:hypothetical protein